MLNGYQSIKNQVQKVYEVTTLSQTFCLVLTVVLVYFFPKMLKGAESYTTNRALERPDYNQELLDDFWMVIPMCCGIRVAKSLVHFLFSGIFARKYEDKYDGEDLEKKITK